MGFNISLDAYAILTLRSRGVSGSIRSSSKQIENTIIGEVQPLKNRIKGNIYGELSTFETDYTADPVQGIQRHPG
jgi:hypothetical protein